MDSIWVEQALAQAAFPRTTMSEVVEYAETLKFNNQTKAACQLYKTWIAHHGEHPSLHAIYFNYSVSLADTEDLVGAVNALREAMRLKPDFCPPYINLGGLFERLGRLDGAIGTWMSLVSSFPAVTPESVSYKIAALKQIGRVLEIAHVPATAEVALHQCLELFPDQPDVIQHFIAIRQGQCRWPTIPDSERLPKNRLVTAISPLSAACYTDDPLFHLANACVYNKRSIGIPGNARCAIADVTPAARNGDRLRIGYVSSDLRNHAVGFAMTDIMETHDRAAFEVHAYYCGINTRDETQKRIRGAVDVWTDLNGLDDVQAARRVRQDGIDILVDLNGYTKDARTGLFALRPAPIAVNWFGFPNTMGSPYHHYIIADDTVIPASHEIYYSEKVVRLPCYQANDRKRVVAAETPSRQDVGLPEHGVVFCCLNGMQKITERTFVRWMKILSRVANSVLWLLSGTEETNGRLRETAAQHGVERCRLVFADKQPNPDHLARLRLADLFLDTYPYGAHTTASDALWMGVPVLTMPGRSFASRVCSSLVRASGLGELICVTSDDYVKLAIELGTCTDRIAEMRLRLSAGRDTCELFDTKLLVTHLEARYREMYAAFRLGALPRPQLRNLDIYHQIGASLDPGVVEGSSDASYHAVYHERLADVDAVAPMDGDGRLWQSSPGSN